MKANEVHKMSNPEILDALAQQRKQLFELRSQAVTEKLENPRQIGAIKRDIARMLTEQRSRQLREAKA